MSRYIDADMIEYFKTFNPNKGEKTIADMAWRSDIDAIPTADVQEVVHGEWIAGKEIAREFLGDKTLHIDYEDYKCSVCGLTLDRLLYCVDGSLFYKFCPNCGARMDL